MAKRFFLHSFIVLSVIAIMLASCVYKETKTVRNMPIDGIDLSNIPDGSYKGDYSYSNFTYEVEVTVKNHRIENIEILKNKDSEYAKKAEGVVENILQAQSLDVDTITGATKTSKAILEAIENALSSDL